MPSFCGWGAVCTPGLYTGLIGIDYSEVGFGIESLMVPLLRSPQNIQLLEPVRTSQENSPLRNNLPTFPLQ